MAAIIKSDVKRIWSAYKSVALEISALLFMASVLMTYLISQDFIMMRVCRTGLEEKYSESICREIIRNTGNYSDAETAIQKEMTRIRRTRSVLDYTIPIIFVIFHGSWSDIYGRKIPLLLPCIGFFFQAMVFYTSHFLQEMDAMSIVIIGAIVKSISGADVTFRMAALSHISDISTKRERTVRTGLMTAAFTIGVPLGFALGGAAMKASIGMQIAFLISAGICATAFLTIVIFVENKPKCVQESGESINDGDAGVAKKKCFTWANLKSVMESLVLSFEGVSKSGRIQICVLIFVIICVNAPIQGEFGVMYLYLRKRLLWDSSDYGMFSTYVSLVGVGGTLMSMGVLCSLLKLSDPAIGFIAGLSQFGGCFMYAFAFNDLMIYLAPAIDMLNGTMAVVAKSMLSKLCQPENFGKLFSFLAVIELLVPLVFDPTYSTVYEHTMESFPGAIFLLSAALTVPPQLTYLFYIYKNMGASASCEITKPSTVPPSKNGKSPGDNKNQYSEDIESQNRNRCSKLLESLSSENCTSYPSQSPVTLKSAMSTTTVDTVIF